MKKLYLAIVIAVFAGASVFFFVQKENSSSHKIPTPTPQSSTTQQDGINVIPTMRDKISENSTWCGTLQLVWNEAIDNIVKQDITFSPQTDVAANLNKRTFSANDLSDTYYYKIFDNMTPGLKIKIEKAIKEKFDQESDILNDFDWTPSPDKYFAYAMLYRKFEFLKTFEDLDVGNFGKETNIKYFGTKDSEQAKRQIDVMCYDNDNNFAVVLNTKTNDQVVLIKNPIGSTFQEIYDTAINKANSFTGDTSLEDKENFKMPNLEINEKKDFLELENKPFSTKNGDIMRITKVIQTIKFKIDKSGGEIKSEAGMAMDMGMTLQENKPREFYIDDTFAIFLREKGKTKPYFAGKISDIKEFQK